MESSSWCGANSRTVSWNFLEFFPNIFNLLDWVHRCRTLGFGGLTVCELWLGWKVGPQYKHSTSFQRGNIGPNAMEMQPFHRQPCLREQYSGEKHILLSTFSPVPQWLISGKSQLDRAIWENAEWARFDHSLKATSPEETTPSPFPTHCAWGLWVEPSLPSKWLWVPQTRTWGRIPPLQILWDDVISLERAEKQVLFILSQGDRSVKSQSLSTHFPVRVRTHAACLNQLLAWRSHLRNSPPYTPGLLFCCSAPCFCHLWNGEHGGTILKKALNGSIHTPSIKIIFLQNHCRRWLQPGN